MSLTFYIFFTYCWFTLCVDRLRNILSQIFVAQYGDTDPKICKTPHPNPSKYFFQSIFKQLKDDSSPGWFTTPPRWSSTPEDHKSELLSPKNINEPTPDVSLSEIIEKSSQFPIKFPIETVRCHYLKEKVSQETLEKNINSAYPIIHEHALHLCSTFLIHQKKFGRRGFYKDISLLGFIERLLSKRAACFLSVRDKYMLMDGKKGYGNWESVGTENEEPPLILENYLSYDELRLSALLSVSSHTYFINDGNRKNCGVFEEERNKIEEDGVIVGLVGTRLHKPLVMEYREVVKSMKQNNQKHGYGRFFIPTLQGKFLNFYGDMSATYDELSEDLKKSDRYIELNEGIYFDTLVYRRRVALSIDTLLIEANDRAKKLNKMAYIHVVGLGLGVWKIESTQDQLFMDTFAERLELLSEGLTNVGDILFAYINHKMAGPYNDGDKLGHIKLHMEDKNGPNVKLTGEDEGKLLVVSWAWDSNSLPGNEFWLGRLSSSGDPAAACSTQIAEVLNWHINSKVSARNLKVATLKGLVTFEEYQQLHRDD